MQGPWEKYKTTTPDAAQPSQDGPWQKYAGSQQQPAVISAPPSATAAPDQDEPGPLDRLAQWGAQKFHMSPEDQAKEQQSFGTILGPSADRFVENAAGMVPRFLTAAPAAAVDAVKHVFSPDAWTPAGSQRAQQQQIDNARKGGTLKVLEPGEAVPMPTSSELSDYGAETLGGLGTGMLAGEAAAGLMRFPGAVKNFVRGDVDAPMPGSGMTARQRYLDAKQMGVNPSMADATASPFLRGVSDVNQRTLRGAPVHQAAATSNLDAVDRYANGYLNQLSPLDPETGGKTIQAPLRNSFVSLQDRAHDLLGNLSPLEGEAGGAKLQNLAQQKMDSLHEGAQAAYKDVSDNYGDLPANNVGGIAKTAEDIGQKNGRFSQQFPSLENRRIAGVIGDAAQLGNESQSLFMGAPRVGDLIRSRSALLDLTRDPEIVKSSYGGDVQRLIAAHDQAIMDSLPEDGRTAWRDANAKWESMKNTFDNPQSPYYHALRTTNPSSLTEGIGPHTPESVRALRLNTGDEGAGIVARGAASKLFGLTDAGEYDLGGLSRQLNREPSGFRDELFGPQHEELQHIGQESQALQPFEEAATTRNPEELVHGTKLGPKTAAGVRALRDSPIKPEGAFGPAAPRIGEPAMGALRRGVATDLLGTTAEGGFNFPRVAGNLERLNPGYRAELFGDQEAPLRKIGQVGRMLTDNSNRSGTGGINIKSGEIGGMMDFADPKSAVSKIIGTVGQRGIAKILTSPRAVDWIMGPGGRPSPFVSPAASTAAIATKPPKEK